MNYIKQLNELYTTLDYKPLTAEAIAVYFVLLQIANKTGWIDEFKVANPVLMSKCNISIDVLKTARNKLKTQGYIDYTKGKNQNDAPKYKIIKLYTTQAEPQAETQAPTQAPTQPLPHINKQNKTKQNNREEDKEEEGENFSSTSEKSDKEKQEKLKRIIDFYENNIATITQYVSEDMEKYLQEGVQEDLIIVCMKEAVSRNKRFWKYVASILNNCLNNKITTAKQFKISQDEFKTNKSQITKKEKPKEKEEYEELYFDNEQEYRKKLFEKQKG